MDNYSIVIIIICQTIVQILAYIKQNAIVRKRFERLESSAINRGDDPMAREIHSMVNKIANSISRDVLQEGIREASSSGEEDEVSSKTGGEFETYDEKEEEEQKKKTPKHNTGRCGKGN